MGKYIWILDNKQNNIKYKSSLLYVYLGSTFSKHNNLKKPNIPSFINKTLPKLTFTNKNRSQQWVFIFTNINLEEEIHFCHWINRLGN